MYRLEFRPAALKALRRLISVTLTVFMQHLHCLPVNRDHLHHESSQGNAYRVWVGDYRIIYTIDDQGRVVWW